MRAFYTVVLSLSTIINSIEFSSQFNRDPSSDGRHPPELTLSSPGIILRTRSRSPRPVPDSLVEPPPPLATFHCFGTAKARSLKLNAVLRRGEHAYIRLIPQINKRHSFEIRKYTFSANEPIQLRGIGHNTYKPMPAQELNVLTTAAGDILAILEGGKYLRGIYSTESDVEVRVKINMYSRVVKEITPGESAESPLGNRQPISTNFILVDERDVSLPQ